MLDNYSIREVTSSSQITTKSDPTLPTVSITPGAGVPTNPQTDLNQAAIIWKMRWFVLVVISIGLFMSIIASIIVALIMKNLLPLTIPSSFALSMRPIIKFLFNKPPRS